MEKTLDQKAAEYADLGEYDLTFVSTRKRSFKDGYTTRNDEVIKMVEDYKIAIQSAMLHSMNKTDSPEALSAKEDLLTDLLTKLKEDKK